MTMPEVIVLFEGYSRELDNFRMDANCSCTLIKGEKLIIVDTMTAWDKDKLIEGLARQSVRPEDINYVVCTHGHPDHVGNNNLFTKAEHIVGHSVHYGTIFYEKNLKDEEYQLCDRVKVIATPGHSSEDVTVLAETRINGSSKRIGITGDLFEKQEDIHNPSIWKDVGNAELQNIQSQMRFNIIKIVDFIVPGHGPMFAVNNDMRKLVESQIVR